MCIVGTSMGATITSIFATKYPSYVSMICLLAPIPRKYIYILFIYRIKFIFSWITLAGEEYQTKILQELRSGSYQMVLPETPKELFTAANAVSMKKVGARRVLTKKYLKFKSSTLDQHKTSKRKINYYIDILNSFLT